MVRSRPARVLAPAVLIAALVAYAWANRFVQDDAFISFRHAANLVAGRGLVWNPGEAPVEGYTNFLWTLLIAAGLAFGLDPVAWSQAIGLGAAAGTLALTYWLGRRATGSAGGAWVVTGLVGTCFSFSAYATGGLETPLQTLLATAALALVVAPGESATGRWRLVALSFVLGLAVLTHYDSVVFAAPLIGVAGLRVGRQACSLTARAGGWAALVLPLAVLVGGWAVWKLSFYGDILPNTFYVKARSGASVEAGIYYLAAFFVATGLVIYLPVLGIAARRTGLGRNPVAAPALLIVAVWFAYVVGVGGDFMEFRLIMPVLPMVYLIVGWLLWCVVTHRQARLALIVLTLIGAGWYTRTFGRGVFQVGGIETVRQLAGHLDAPAENWRGIGRTLGAIWSPESGVVIATSAAGAIPYESRLTTVDMLGLNDRWIAHHGPIVTDRAGHQRAAPLSYLIDRGVHLVVGHPRLLPASVPACSLGVADFVAVIDRPLDPTFRLLRIPIDPERDLIVLSLNAHPEIAAAYDRFGGRTEAPADCPPAKRSPS